MTGSMLKILRFLALFCLVISIIIIDVSQSSGQTVWSTPKKLSVERSAWFPELAVDSGGRVHVVYSSGRTVGIGQSYDVVMYTSSDDTVNWTDPKDIVAIASKGAVTRPYILIDANGVLHLTYRSYSVFYTRMPARSVNIADMTEPMLVSLPENGYFSQVYLDRVGRLHMLHTENIQSVGCTGCFHVYYRQSLNYGETWTAPIDISPISNGVAKPQILVDNNDVIHVVWEAGRGGDLGQVPDPATVMYTNSEDLGLTWSAPRQLPVPGSKGRNITIGMDPEGDLVIVYLAEVPNLVYFQTSSDGGSNWTTPQPISNLISSWNVYSGVTDGYSMAADNAGHLHLVVVGQLADDNFIPMGIDRNLPTSTPEASPTPTIDPDFEATPTVTTTTDIYVPSILLETPSVPRIPLSVLHVEWDGTAWSQPEAITTIFGDVPEWPRIAVGLGNQLHVVWFIRDEAHIWDSGGGTEYQVFYSKSLSSAPAVNPVVPPDPVIRMAVTPTHTPEPEASAPVVMAETTETSQPVHLQREVLVYKEMDYLIIAGVSIIPSLLVVIGASWIIKKIKR
jgi:hypothetical protein